MSRASTHTSRDSPNPRRPTERVRLSAEAAVAEEGCGCAGEGEEVFAAAFADGGVRMPAVRSAEQAEGTQVPVAITRMTGCRRSSRWRRCSGRRPGARRSRCRPSPGVPQWPTPERTACPTFARGATNVSEPRVVIWSRSSGRSTGRPSTMCAAGPGDRMTTRATPCLRKVGQNPWAWARHRRTARPSWLSAPSVWDHARPPLSVSGSGIICPTGRLVRLSRFRAGGRQGGRARSRSRSGSRRWRAGAA